MSTIHPTSQPRSASTVGPERYTGYVVYIYAFDVAYEMTRQPVRELLGQPVAQFMVDATKRSPRQLFFYRPQMVRLPLLERIGPRGPVRVERTIKLLPVGAISITVRVPFDVARVEDLVVYHDLHFTNGSLYEEVRALAEEVRRELRPYYIKPVERLNDEEAYTVFCIEAPIATAAEAVTGAEAGQDAGAASGAESASAPQHLHFSAEDWLLAHRREVSALLTQEDDIAHLSEQESDESTGRYLSYYDHDLVVVDWDAALIIDEPRYFDETLYAMELANLQLAELEAYDRILDGVVERSYRDLGGSRRRGKPDILRALGEIRIDLARLSDELSNITKFFGDWHLARIYQTISARFHLADWHHTIDEKLKTLDGMYQLLKQDQNNRWMMILELTIVLLFIIDLVIILRGH